MNIKKIMECRRFNPVLKSWKTKILDNKGSLMNHNKGKKRREIIFMRFVIASLVTRLNLVESKKLICENCHSAAAIRGKGEGQTFRWQIIFPEDWSRQIHSFHFQSQLFPTTKWAWANQPIFPASQTQPQVHSAFFWLTLFDFIINYSNWLSCD